MLERVVNVYRPVPKSWGWANNLILFQGVVLLGTTIQACANRLRVPAVSVDPPLLCHGCAKTARESLGFAFQDRRYSVRTQKPWGGPVRLKFGILQCDTLTSIMLKARNVRTENTRVGAASKAGTHWPDI